MGTIGSRRGVRRGRGSNGAIYVNGHRAVPARLHAAIIDTIKRLDRPVTVTDLAWELKYSKSHIGNHLAGMLADGDVCRVAGPCTALGLYALYDIPGRVAPDEPLKSCSKCGQSRPYEHFQRDRTTPTGRASQCRYCRSPKTDKSTVLIYPNRDERG